MGVCVCGGVVGGVCVCGVCVLMKEEVIFSPCKF